jgi:cytosine/adenosine deaminase-related metal-dependent hydrolase
LYGDELRLTNNCIIFVNDHGIIEKIGKHSGLGENAYCSNVIENKNTHVIDAEGYIIIPGLVNSHTHIGDAIGKDISSNADLDTRVNPNQSIKKTILEKTETGQLKQSMRNTAISMLNKGITTFVDFREGDINGVKMLQTAIKDVPIKSIILGRIDFSGFYENTENKTMVTISNASDYDCGKLGEGDKEEEEDNEEFYRKGEHILNLCDGFGISGAN